MELEVLKQLQNAEFEILLALDDFCRLNDIEYSLYAGTMLGAVRHHGFIPWDDDIDVAMTREEYSKFCRTILEKPMDGFFFENYETNTNCGTCHGKLRKLGTIFLQKGEIEGKGHHELWVDIFPLDKYALNKDGEKARWIGRQNVFLTRANVGNVMDSRKKRIVRFLIRLIPVWFRHRVLIYNTRWLEKNSIATNDNYYWMSMSTLENIDRYRFPQDICEEYDNLEFNGHQFRIFKKYKEMLSHLYGDYMILPPVEERVCSHNPIKIVF